MRISIIGAGNMGGAIALGLAKSFGDMAIPLDIVVSNPNEDKLHAIKEQCPNVETFTDNDKAVVGADIVILAVKPWILQSVITEIKPRLNYERQAIISVAGGVSIDDLDKMLVHDGDLPAVFHIIPDTAIAVGKSMTFIASARASKELVDTVKQLFETLGDVAMIEERLMGAATALSSCGIAYVYKYVQACVQAGVQLGFYPEDALKYVISTIEGAMEMLRVNGTLPQQEIDRVTTPGGMTIRGINALEHGGFTSAVIEAILKPLSK